MSDHLLSLTTFLPILGVLLLLFIPKDSKGVLRGVALAVTVVTFLVSLPILIRLPDQRRLPVYGERALDCRRPVRHEL